MTDWTKRAGFGVLPKTATAALSRLHPVRLPRAAVLFQPGESARGFAVLLSGRIEVFLVGPTGRDILLYAVVPGQACVQSTLGLLADQDYSAEAIASVETDLVLIPRALFLDLMAEPGFRSHVFRAFAERLSSMMQVIEKVAFQRIESRLAEALLALAQDEVVSATQAELAARVGTAREVISRRLDGFVRARLVATERGQVRIIDRAGLRQRAAADEGGAS